MMTVISFLCIAFCTYPGVHRWIYILMVMCLIVSALYSFGVNCSEARQRKAVNRLQHPPPPPPCVTAYQGQILSPMTYIESTLEGLVFNVQDEQRE